jgi:DNA-directed RNA polymerase specialized sigma24 family protein
VLTDWVTQRQVVELAYYHGLSYQEIATLVGCPVNTVKTRMARARERLVPQLTALGLVSTLPGWLQIPH